MAQKRPCHILAGAGIEGQIRGDQDQETKQNKPGYAKLDKDVWRRRGRRRVKISKRDREIVRLERCGLLVCCTHHAVHTAPGQAQSRTGQTDDRRGHMGRKD